MPRRGIILLLLAIMFAGNAEGTVTNIPASQDVYISMGAGNALVYNQTDTLLCGINVTEVNNTSVSSYPGVPVIQFDISSVNITDDDVAILVLKAASIRMPDNSALVALLPIGSDWNEESDLTTFLVNILPAWSIIKKNDLTQLSSNTDGDEVFAFDVSKKLLEAQAKGDKISFLLELISNHSSEIDFLSRETGQGPYLMVMPYPALPLSDQSDQILPTDSSSSELSPVPTFGFVSEENASQTAEMAPVALGLQSNHSSNEKIDQE